MMDKILKPKLYKDENENEFLIQHSLQSVIKKTESLWSKLTSQVLTIIPKQTYQLWILLQYRLCIIPRTI